MNRLEEIFIDNAYLWPLQVGHNWFVNIILTKLVNEMPKSSGKLQEGNNAGANTRQI